jgi:hypothetical protein
MSPAGGILGPTARFGVGRVEGLEGGLGIAVGDGLRQRYQLSRITDAVVR